MDTTDRRTLLNLLETYERDELDPGEFREIRVQALVDDLRQQDEEVSSNGTSGSCGS